MAASIRDALTAAKLAMSALTAYALVAASFHVALKAAISAMSAETAYTLLAALSHEALLLLSTERSPLKLPFCKPY